MKICFMFFLMSWSFVGFAQTKVSGVVYDENLGEVVDFAVIATAKSSTMSNAQGEFELLLASLNDTLIINHPNYKTKRISTLSPSMQIKLTPASLQAHGVTVSAGRLDRLDSVKTKYYRHFHEDSINSLSTSLYYRHSTVVDTNSVEYIEAIFDARSYTAFSGFSLTNGRYAKGESNTEITFKNAYVFSNFSPISFNKPYDNDYPYVPLCTLASTIYDVELIKVLNDSTPDRVNVYRFTPKSELPRKIKRDVTLIEGELHIRTRDNAIVAFEGVATDRVAMSMGLFLRAQNKKLYLSFTYVDVPGIAYPVLKSARTELHFTVNILGKNHSVRVSSIAFATDYSTDQVLDKELIKSRAAITEEIDRIPYDPKFWENNPVIKRTSVEQKVVDDFNRQGYFGDLSF